MVEKWKVWGINKGKGAKKLRTLHNEKSCAEAAWEKGLIVENNFNSAGIITFEYLVYVSNRHLFVISYN